ncbi:biosynthetic peptidoglycan transglycosylase [Olivibacter sitiensis]|uniref:biosynthetic peptidoglycan transglycosylase n=1 Tax=Olivibacter sitiensis TaxID=376470 RepID=UPI0004099693|nr:biosynthetic peptidoglycan transglycosylase [Olivibacter sitiensis]
MFDIKKIKLQHRHLKVAAYIIGAFFLVALIALFVIYKKRDDLLKHAIAKTKAKLLEDYEIDFQTGKYGFSGFKTVYLSNISLVPQQRDTLLTMNTLAVSVKFWPLLKGEIQVSEVQTADIHLQFVKRDTTSNYDFLFRKQDKEKDLIDKNTSTNLAQLADGIINSVLYKIPDNMELSNLIWSYRDDSLNQRLTVPEATIRNGNLQSTIWLNAKEALWHLTGKVDPGNKHFNIKLFAENQPIELPVIKKKYGLTLRFDTLSANLDQVSFRQGDNLEIVGGGGVSNLSIHHWRINEEPVTVDNAHIEAILSIGKNYIELKDKSTFHLKNMMAHPYAKLTLDSSKKVQLGLRMPEQSAQDFFDALPHGLFDNLEGIRVAGKLKYTLDFAIDMNMPDSVKLYSSLDKKDFKINSWGKTNLSKINAPFVYTPYEYGKPMRNILVSTENPNFTPIDQISPYLKNAILTAEDPSFFSHKGFVNEAIRNSIATNIKVKSFKRGGSTISMQLVKNVYLGREKTLARKIEEILMVWLIENNRVSSKERMFEVYLNIIEWGRNVYGIGEASRYYFGKSASELNLGESIYLTSIVPKPKTGLYPFQYTGELKPYMGAYYRLIGGIMARRGLAPYDSTNTYGMYNVSLREPLRPAKPAYLETDSLAIDSIYIDEEVEEKRNLFQRIFGGGKKEKNEDDDTDR